MNIRFVNNTVRLVVIKFTFSVMKVKGLVFILNVYSLYIYNIWVARIFLDSLYFNNFRTDVQ